MAIHPIEYRYGTDEMKDVWSEGTRLTKLPSVETAFLYVLGSNMLRMGGVRELL